MSDESLKFPIGHYERPSLITPEDRQTWIGEISALPGQLEQLVSGWTDDRLDTPYRPGGWTVRRLIHHIADSHLNAYCRVKLALTEDNPAIKPYGQDAWAGLPDASELPVKHSLMILKGIHARWTFTLEKLGELDWQRTFLHPEYKKTFTVESVTGLYAWHGRHHLAHIEGLKKQKGW